MTTAAIVRLTIALLLSPALSAQSLTTTQSNFLLGFDYSESGPYLDLFTQFSADQVGGVYVLASCTPSNVSGPSCLTKISADGKAVLWQKTLDFTARMAVDPNGGVYLISLPVSGMIAGNTNVWVEKLGLDGSVIWKNLVTTSQASYIVKLSFTVDEAGRVFIAGSGPASNIATAGSWVVRLNTAGTMDAIYPDVPQPPSAIAVDPTGSQIIVSIPSTPAYLFARLTADHPTWVTFASPRPTAEPVIAVAPNGDAILYGSDSDGNYSLQRIDPGGAVVFSKAIASSWVALAPTFKVASTLAVDGQGNAYIIGYTLSSAMPVKNSLTSCGYMWLSVFAADGTVLQTTYLPAGLITTESYGHIAIGPNSAVYLFSGVSSIFAATQTGPLPQIPPGATIGTALIRLSPNPKAQTVPLTCIANGATFSYSGGVAPGEILTLFGTGLGPQVGVVATASMDSPFATQVGDVQVTFDGKPAPLMWVQDAQVNVSVPWEVAGSTTQICVTYNGAPASCQTSRVSLVSPGVFTVDGIHAAAVNQDGTINSPDHPAPPDSWVSVYATGLGPTSPAQADGALVRLPLPSNTFPVSLRQACTGTGCVPAQSDVIYAGPAAFLISGASQINFWANQAISGQATAKLSLAVQTPTGTVTSNYFQIYVAGY